MNGDTNKGQAMGFRKALIRKQLQAVVRAAAFPKREYDVKIAEHLESFLAKKEPRAILGYWPLPDEPDVQSVWRNWQQKIPFYLPVLEVSTLRFRRWAFNESFESGPYGLLQPPTGAVEWAKERGTLLVVPCVGIHEAGYRLGRGLGAYDRFVSQHRDDLQTICGLSYECQAHQRFSSDSWDLKLTSRMSEEGEGP